jgi:hypothetical protein
VVVPLLVWLALVPLLVVGRNLSPEVAAANFTLLCLLSLGLSLGLSLPLLLLEPWCLWCDDECEVFLGLLLLRRVGKMKT